MEKLIVSKYGMAQSAFAYGPSQMMIEGQSVYLVDKFVSHGFDGPETMAVVQLKQGLADQYIFPMSKLEVAA